MNGPIVNATTLVLVAGLIGCGADPEQAPPDAAVGDGGADGGSVADAAPSDGGPAGDAAPSDGGPEEAPDYDRLFPTDRVVVADLAIEPADWEALLADPFVELYVPATLTWDGVVVDQVGVRLKGNSSLSDVAESGGERYSLKVDIDYYVPDQDLFGVDKLNLNNVFRDPSYLRERLATDLFRAMGVPTPRTTFVWLTKNGEPFGLYSGIEQVDKDFLRANFPDDEGNLYKPEPPAGELRWLGDAYEDYPGFELKTNEEAPDHTALLHLLDVVNNEEAERISEVLDVDRFLRWLAADAAMVLLDAYVGPGHNYYLYEDRSTGLFVLIPWDTNSAYGTFRCQLTPDQLLALPHLRPTCGPPTERPLVDRVLSVAAWREQYEAYLRELLDGPWSAETVAAQVDALGALVRDRVAEDPTAFIPFETFEASLHDDVTVGRSTFFGLTSFASRRAAVLDAELP